MIDPTQRYDILIHAYQAGKYSEVEQRANQLLLNEPDNPKYNEILALALSAQGYTTEAICVFKRIVKYNHESSQCWFNLAVTYQQNNQPDSAMNAYRACLRYEPDHSGALWNYGELLRNREFFEPAAFCFETLLKNSPEPPKDIFHRLAVCYAHLEITEQANETFEKALAGNSSDPAVTRWEYAHHLLAHEQFQQGWVNYEYRFDAGIKSSVVRDNFSPPFWQGESLHNKTLLVHGEQGLGDEIMFASILPEIIVECKQLIIGVQPPLVDLFRHSFPLAIVRPHQTNRRPVNLREFDNTIDYVTAIGSLANFKRQRKELFQANTPYLSARY